MPAFQAINVEPEENSDDEVDTTRQLHIDEALKRFQTALKLHAQGPRFFDEAADAYDDLFKSDIFQYPEAATEYERAERPGYLVVDASLTDLQAGDVDNADSTLPQALYLAHKNHGSFLLDRIKYSRKLNNGPREEFFSRPDVLKDAQDALVDYNAALDRDPSDAELWRRTARVAAFLKSARIRRYCLEAAVELDDDPAVEEVEPPSLAEGLAGEELKKQLNVLSDELSLSHPMVNPWVNKEMPALLKRHLDPIPFLPNAALYLQDLRSAVREVTETRAVLQCSKAAWPDLGMALVQFIAEVGFSGRAVVLDLPSLESDDDVAGTAEAIERQLADTTNDDKADERTTETMDVDQATKEKDGPTTEIKKSITENSRKGGNESAPTRKRSQSVAGLVDGGEDENAPEKRSKRIRRRETAAEEAVDPSTLHASQLAELQAADRNLFQMTKDALENMGITDSDTLGCLDEVLESCQSEDRGVRIRGDAAQDLRNTILSFTADNAKILINKKEVDTLGMSAFLEHAKGGCQKATPVSAFKGTQGVGPFARRINSVWATAQEIAWQWVMAIAPSYLDAKWSDLMKTTVVQVISRFDGDILEATKHELDRVKESGASHEEVLALGRIVQMLFELHLDIYERITNPNSAVDYSIRVEAKGRLGRWLDFVTELLRYAGPADNNLTARFLWASVFSTTLTENASREYILMCWTSLRDYLSNGNFSQIHLQNNAVLPEISAAAADREISKLTTMDFFLGLFQDDISDPVAVIDHLEPVLNPSSVYVPDPNSSNDQEHPNSTPQNAKPPEIPIQQCASQGLQDLWKFVNGTSTELRLFLWTRLGDAYSKIGYLTKQFSCELRAIEMVVADFQGEHYLKNSGETRPALLLRMLKSLDELLIHALSMALNEPSSYDIIDEDHLQTTSAALAKLSSMLHVAAIVEDEIRIGITAAPSNASSFHSFLNKLRELQVRTWCLQYTVLKAAMRQDSDVFPKDESDLAEYLAASHQVLGLRNSCKASNKIFLKMMRVELLKFKNMENWEDYLGQVLYDLHGLKLGVGIWDVQDHGCPPERLERRNTIQLADKITGLARQIPMKDLLKSDLRTTIEHMQGAIGPVPSTPQMVHNLRNYTEYFKKPIHPLRLYQALKGAVELDTVSVNAPETALAKHGWFSLQGLIALSKYKLVDLSKRQTPGAMDDLRIGATFLRHQLQFTPNNWEVWFRLAECFDYEVEDAVVWSADKMNKERSELVKFQRNSIHCHTLALSKSVGAPTDSEDGDPLHDLYHNFGMRLYASSREPFAMESFHHADQERFFIEAMGLGTFQRALHSEMKDYKVWKFAAGLFRKAMRKKPMDWRNSFMISKCLWKMYQKQDGSLDEKDRASKPSVERLIEALEHAVDVVHSLPKSRHSDPILEPHYKILSIVHKLVTRGDLQPPEGADILSRQPFGTELGDNTMNDADDWEEYVIRSLRQLRDRDKSNWQHRMIVRHARLLFDEHSETTGDYVQAKAAFNVLRESMFTKTMVMNVWKCDAERPGRHHVFTEQYVRFMVNILVVMKDRVSMEALLRRIRKKGGEFYHFNDLWQTCCVTYLRLIRQTHKVQAGQEESFKSVTPEEFEIMSERISNWAADGMLDLPVLQCMKEAIEIKRLNGGLIKAAPIDDLITDCYSTIYQEVGPSLPGPPPADLIDETAQAAKALADEANELKANSSLSNLLNPPSGQESGANGEGGDKQAEATPRRRVGVRRPDILRKAEQAYIRNLEAPKGGAVKSRVGSMSSKRGSQTPVGVDAASEAADEAVGDDDDIEMKDEPAVDEGGRAAVPETAASSPRGSIHDSADDESDLSDVPEGWDEEPPPSLFPNLGRSTTAGGTSDSSDDGEVGADEEAEADVEEEDGERPGEGDDEEEEGDADAEVGENEEGEENEEADQAEEDEDEEIDGEGDEGREEAEGAAGAEDEEEAGDENELEEELEAVETGDEYEVDQERSRQNERTFG